MEQNGTKQNTVEVYFSFGGITGAEWTMPGRQIEEKMTKKQVSQKYCWFMIENCFIFAL